MFAPAHLRAPGRDLAILGGSLVVSAWAEPSDNFDGAGVTSSVLQVWVGTQATFSGDYTYMTHVKGVGFTDDAQIATSGQPRVTLTTNLELTQSRSIRCSGARGV